MNTARIRIGVGLLLLAVALAIHGGKSPASPQDPSNPAPVVAPVVVHATSATYVYEKDATAVPSEVMSGLNRLNRERKIVATLFEQDSTDGDAQVPDQYKIPVAKAKEAGLPALVVLAGDKVLAVVKDPKTEKQVWEAAP